MRRSRLTTAMAAGAGALLMAAACPALSAEPTGLRVGAAKTDITPTKLDKLYPLGGGAVQFEGVHDPIYARALVVDNGSATVAIVATDLIELGDTLPLRQRVQRELAIPADHIIITASHDHSAPKLRDDSPEEAAYTKTTDDKIVAALKAAKAALQPARMGRGTGSADVNVNRDEYRPVASPAGPQGWDLGFNPKGPSDKTVWVAKFETLQGEPIAILFNYGVHSVVTMRTQLISGDLAGAAEHVVEQHYGDKVVALFTIGAAGDQNPKFSGAPLNGPVATVPSDAEMKLFRARAWPAMESQGYMLGAEVLRVADTVQATVTAPRLAGAESSFTCAAKPDKRWASMNGVVPLTLGVIRIGDIAFASVSGEVVTNIETRLKAASPLSDTVFITLANGRSGYFVDDAAYDAPIFEVGASPAARGCAEGGIVNGLVKLIRDGR